MNRDLVVLAWDGQGEWCPAVQFDVAPQFDVLRFDYSGAAVGPLPPLAISRKAGGKGEVCGFVAAWLQQSQRAYDYVGLIDDDVLTRVSDLNYLLHIARVLALDVFSPALSEDGATAHSHMLRMPNRYTHRVPWVDIMAAFFKVPLFLAASPHFGKSISAWGLDCFVFPLVQKLAGLEHTAVVDAVMVRHCRAVGSANRILRNGLTGWQELDAVHAHCVDLIRREHPALAASAWFDELFTQTFEHLRRQRGPGAPSIG